MLHIIDKSSRGSVLMEFVMVLPIYLLFMGMIFLLGEMGVKTLWLTSADRSSAFDTGRAGDWEADAHGRVAQDQFEPGEAGNLTCWGNTYRTNAQTFNGAWSWLASGMSTYKYALPSWTHSWLSYPHHVFSVTTGTDPESIGGVLGKLLYGGAGAFDFIVSKETSRRYTYYTLKRTELSRDEDAYRYWDPKYLTASDLKNKKQGTGIVWYDKIFDEAYAESSHTAVDGLLGAAQEKDTFDGRAKRSDYDRFGMFMIWSQ